MKSTSPTFDPAHPSGPSSVGDASPPAQEKVGGVSAIWVVIAVLVITLGLGIAFFIVANAQPIELVKP